MLDPKFIRQNIELVRKAVADKGEKANLDEFLGLDERRRGPRGRDEPSVPVAEQDDRRRQGNDVDIHGGGERAGPAIIVDSSDPKDRVNVIVSVTPEGVRIALPPQSPPTLRWLPACSASRTRADIGSAMNSATNFLFAGLSCAAE